MFLGQMSTENRPVQSPAARAHALAAALPRMTEEMHRINGLFGAGHRHEATEQFFALASMAIRTQRDDVSCKGYVIQGRTTAIGVCRIPAQPRPDKPIALFLPGLLSALPLAAVRSLAFVDLFDVVLCELPGHGASGSVGIVSLEAFAAEYAAVIDTALTRAAGLAVIGESLGGLVALALARLRPARIRNVILIDTPFHLTRPDPAAWIGEVWRNSGRRPYVRRICLDIMGFDPTDGRVERTASLYDMARDAPFGCVHIMGSNQQSAGIASVVCDADIAALQAANPAMLITPRVAGTGHAVLLDNPAGARAALEALIVSSVQPTMATP
jgi:pimeloyl-ACP methyl ester carboxylesterase